MSKKKYPLEFPEGEHQNCQTLTGLTVEHLPRDGSLGRIKRYRSGADVWQPDDQQDRLYFLQSGQVAVVISDMEGREVVLRMIEVGEPFGELCFCGRYKLRGSFARTATPSEAVEINLADFMEYLQTERDVIAAFLFTFCIRLADAESRLAILAHRGAEERLGRLLLHLAATRGGMRDEPTGEVSLPVSHDELAQMAAMSRPHVTLTMGRLRQRGLVRYERGRPLFVNVSALRAYFIGE
ncbi:MAG: Crp/Fnr family transcriptional regulator [Pyrinomonadaceae bacterium]|nr:Crp/Fnr family transcriptional regulator [Pyrinomonadaceae bacterium]